MRMASSIGVLIVALAGFAAGQTQVSKDQNAIEGLSAQWVTSVNGKNVALLMELVTDDVVFLIPNAPAVKGKAAAEQMFKALFAQYDLEISETITETQVTGGSAVSLTEVTRKLTPVKGGTAIDAAGSGMMVVRKDTEGSWKISRVVNTLAPPPATPR